MQKLESFQSPTTGMVSVSKMVEEISAFVRKDPSEFYRLVIGSDSQAKNINGTSEIDFVTAIVVHRQGKVQFITGEKKTKLKFQS